MNQPDQIARKRMTRPQAILSYIVLTAAIATGLAVFTSATTIIALIRTATTVLFLPLLLSLVLTFLLEPLVTLIERKAGNRSLSIFLVYFLLAVASYLALQWMIPHWQKTWSSLQDDLPRYLSQATAYLNNLVISVHEEFPFIEAYDLPARLRSMVEQFFGGLIVSTPKSALRVGGLFLIVPLFTFFFLRDGNKIVRTCISLTPNRTFELVHDLTYRIILQLAHFIRGRILEATIIGIIVFAGLSLTDIRYAGFLAVFAGVTNLVPYIGPLVGMVPGILIALVDLGLGGQFWWIVIVYFLIAQVIVDNFILIPILISRFSNLHPLWVIIAIIIGGKLFGVLGMIIGVPIASTIKITLIEIRQYRRTFSLVDSSIDVEQLN